MVGSPIAGSCISFVSKLWDSASKSSVAWLGVHRNVTLTIFCRCSCNILATIPFPFLCFVLFLTNTSASSSFPCCSNIRVSFTFLICCVRDFLDHGGISSTIGSILGHSLFRVFGLTSPAGRPVGPIFIGESVGPISVNPAFLSLS